MKFGVSLLSDQATCISSMDVLDLYGNCWLMGKMKNASSLREDGHFTGKKELELNKIVILRERTLPIRKQKDDNRLVSVSISGVQIKSDPVARIKWLIISFPVVSCYI
jgi:hypothetical protein